MKTKNAIVHLAVLFYKYRLCISWHPHSTSHFFIVNLAHSERPIGDIKSLQPQISAQELEEKDDYEGEGVMEASGTCPD